MQPSKFQFVNPYLKELYFNANKDFDANQAEFEMQNSFNVKISRSERENRANVELALEINYEKEVNGKPCTCQQNQPPQRGGSKCSILSYGKILAA